MPRQHPGLLDPACSCIMQSQPSSLLAHFSQHATVRDTHHEHTPCITHAAPSKPVLKHVSLPVAASCTALLHFWVTACCDLLACLLACTCRTSNALQPNSSIRSASSSRSSLPGGDPSLQPAVGARSVLGGPPSAPRVRATPLSASSRGSLAADSGAAGLQARSASPGMLSPARSGHRSPLLLNKAAGLGPKEDANVPQSQITVANPASLAMLLGDGGSGRPAQGPS